MLEENRVNERSLYDDWQLQRHTAATSNLLVQHDVPQHRIGKPLTEVDISSDSSSSSTSFLIEIKHILFGLSPSLNTTVTQSTQDDGEEVVPTSVHPDNRLRNEVQGIKDTFLATPVATTIIQPSQGDGEEAAPISVQPEYTMLLVKAHIAPYALND